MGSKPGRGCNVLSAMISFKTNPLLLVFAVLSVYSCTKDPVAPVTTPGLELLDFTELKRTSVILKANPSSAIHITECGFLVGKSYDLNDARKYPIADYTDGEMSLELTGLEIGATYYYQAYLADGEQALTTATNSFTTATQSAPLISDFKLTGSTLSATISDNGGRSITHAGFCWGTQENPDIFGHSAEVTVSGNSFSMTLPDVAINTTYYFRAFADNGADGNNAIAYSAEQVTYRKDEESQLVLSSSEVVTSQDSGTFEIVVQANIDFTVQNPDVDWIHPVGTKAAESHTLTYLVDKNETYEDRYAEIKIIAASIGKTETVSVKQVQKDAIVVAKDSYTVNASGGTVQFTVNHNVEYDTSIRVDWIKLVDTKTMTSDELSFSVEPNSSLDNREGQIVFTSKDGAITQHVAIYQAQTNSIVVSETEKVIGPDGGTFEIVVNANIEYNVTDPDVDWIRLIETKSTSSRTLVYSVESNTGYSYRTGHLVISVPSTGETETVTITQLSKNNITFADAKVKEILVAEFDTDHDGEISYEEAASVTSLFKTNSTETKSVFQGSDITTFEEFRFFTGMEELEYIPGTKDDDGHGTFQDCIHLSSIVLPESLITINGLAFSGCSSLASIVIPENVTTIGWRAFHGCSSLFSIILPESVSLIGDEAFAQCTSLPSVQIPETVKIIYNRVFQGCSGLSSISLPQSLVYIFISAFEDCISLESVSIPDNVSYIGEKAFYGCKSLKSVKLPSRITTIDYRTFTSCSNLASIVIPMGVTSIESGAFEGCTSMGSVTIPSSVTSIGAAAFSKCSSIPSIVIPDGITSIEMGVFQSCSSLTSINIPDGVTNIGGSAFYNCTSLKELSIPESVTSIGGGAFYYCTSLASITIPDGVTSIEENLFYGCSALTTITISEGVTSIGSRAYSGCSNLATIPGMKNVTSIGAYAFSDCTSLVSITLPENITDLEAGMFSGCSNLKSVSIPSGVASIGRHAFESCSSLMAIDLPESVTSIGQSAFWRCSNLSSISIPDGVDSIEAAAFLGCSNLATIRIPDGVTSISPTTFYQCSNLASVTLSPNITTIGEFAFHSCSSLQSVSIPKNVTEIEQSAFASCVSLKSITVNPIDPPTLENSSPIFSETNDCPIFVPQDSLEKYKTSSGWSEYADRIQAMP